MCAYVFISRCAVVIMLVVMLGGCSAPPKDHWAGDAPAPAPDGGAAPVQQFDYTHKVLQPETAQLGRRHTVALIRFGDTKGIEDVPFGREPPPQDTQSGEVNVAVNIGTRTETHAEEGPQMTRRARAILKHALLESEAFVVVERERILDVLREINFSQTRYVDPETAPEGASLLAVRYLLEGSLGLNEDQTLKGHLRDEPKYEDLSFERPGLLENIFNPRGSRQRRLTQFRAWQARMARERARQYYNIACYLSAYDVHTGEVVTSVMGLGATRSDAIRDAVDELVDELAEHDSEIRVAAVAEQRVYLDVGEQSGLQPGARLQVLRPGVAIRDRDGAIIGYDETEAGEVEVVEIRHLYSIAKPVATVQPLQRGDFVRPAHH